ncbi:MAG: histidine kinase [Flavobacteriales bacterium]|nr:histidine kinase [Flavobacteriales bacterium]
MNRLLKIFLLLLFAKISVIAQQYSFINYSVEDGLAQTQVFDLESDTEGYVWVGTAGGVSRFDGESFVNFSTENGLIDNTVKEIVVHNESVWIASQYGITCVKNKKVVSWDLMSIAQGRGIASFTFDQSNSLWLAIKGKGVYKIPVIENQLNLTEIVHYSLDQKNLVKTIFCDNNGTVWAGGTNILGFFKDDLWNSDSTQNYHYSVTSFSQAKDGEIIYSTQSNGIFALDNQQITNIPFSKNFGTINHIYNDQQNRLWISTNSGAFLLEDQEVKHFTVKNGLINDRVKNIIEDREGNIWLGTDGGGIIRFTSDELVSYSKLDGLSSDYILSISEDVQNNIYFSTYGGGVNKFYDNKIEIINQKDGIGDNTIWASLTYLDSSLWFGTANGLSILKDNKLTTFKNVDWLPSNKILAIKKDEFNTIWVGTSKGVTKVGMGEVHKVYKYKENFPAKNVRTIENSLTNNIWLGTSSGVFEVDGDSIKALDFNESLQNKIVYSLKKVNDDLLLIGTGNGLYAYYKGDLKRIELHESFSANNINFIGIEDSNFVWVGTNYGIFELRTPDLFQTDKSAIHHYSTTNGLPSIETNLNAFYKDKRGFLWMGTSKGVVRYKRKRERQAKVLPTIKIDKVQLFLKDTDWKKHTNSINENTNLPVNLSVGYKKNYFTFFYKGISIKQNKELRYSVKLEGFDSEWSPIVTQQSITYTNLPHGAFTFKVKATNDGFNWSKPASFSFVIKKPFFLSWWFFMLLFVLMILIGGIIWKWQQRVSKRKALTQKLYYKSKLLALEQQTLNASMNRHFIFNSLNSIQYYINTKDRISANKYLTNFAKLIRKNLDSSVSGNNLVSLSDELERLALYLSLENMRFQSKFSYEINLSPAIDSDMIEVPPMFLQPYVENSIWHGILPLKRKGKIQINLSVKENKDIFIVIEDNGLGIDKSLENKNKDGHASKGMLITSGRLEILKKTTNQEFNIKGPYQLENDQKEILGTRVEITIKREKEKLF